MIGASLGSMLFGGHEAGRKGRKANEEEETCRTMIDAMGNLQVSRGRHQSLLFCEHVQPQKRILNIHLPY